MALMQPAWIVLGLTAALVLAWLVWRSREAEVRELRDRVLRLRTHEAELETRLEILGGAEQQLSNAFKALSADALSQNNRAFLDLATLALVAPVRASLDKVDEKIQQVEKDRAGAYSELREQVRGLAESQSRLGIETGKLATALRAPFVRGRWGEMQLRRVVEMAGMLERCDFLAQPTVDSEDERLRPDLLVNLPAGKCIVVDAKTPLAAYLEAIDAPDEETRKARMADHARQVRDHLQALSRKSYFEQFEQSPEFVVLFLPGESFFSAALENDPSLIEFGAGRNVILATPTTLIALLRAVAYGWRQESLAQNAAEISELGRELYKRVADMAEHWSRLGVSLTRAVHAYNSASGSLESRVLASARKFEQLKTAPAGVEIKTIKPVESAVRQASAAAAEDGGEC
jgi:DNA recombination protein RmuC